MWRVRNTRIDGEKLWPNDGDAEWSEETKVQKMDFNDRVAIETIRRPQYYRLELI